MSQNQKMDQEGESSSPVAVWPILFAFLPPLLSLVFGSTQIWGELLLLLVILFYLKYVLQVPWDLYRQAHGRRITFQQALQRHSSSHSASYSTSTNKTVSSASIGEATAPYDRDLETSETAKLQSLESKYLLFCITSPLIGGLLLELFRRRASTFLVLSRFDILLFILAASVRPIMLLCDLSKQQIQELETSHILVPSSQIEDIQNKLLAFEMQVQVLRAQNSLPQDLAPFETSLSAINEVLEDHSKQQRKLEKRFEKFQQGVKQRFKRMNEMMLTSSFDSGVALSDSLSQVSGSFSTPKFRYENRVTMSPALSSRSPSGILPPAHNPIAPSPSGPSSVATPKKLWNRIIDVAFAPLKLAFFPIILAKRIFC